MYIGAKVNPLVPSVPKIGNGLFYLTRMDRSTWLKRVKHLSIAFNENVRFFEKEI